ncbi:MAG: DUF4339 domain-containing protein [Verrucomicrobiota bacterium]|nr:DUF4339 domain-containing protein [Verrucomicrobiota bacterium]
MQIHVDRGGQRFGPYSLEDVNRYLADGTLLPSDIGWHEGASDWVPLTQISGVKAGEGPPSSPSPPAPTAADAAGASSPSGPPAAPTAADAAQPKAPQGTEGAAPESGKSKGGALKIVAIVLLLAGLGAGGYFFIYPKYFAKNGGGDNNGTAVAAWQTLPEGAPILGGADIVVHIKAGEIFNSPLIQQLLAAAPDAGMAISMMQQNAGIGPGDLQDLTISVTGVSAVAQSVDDPDKSEDALEKAYESGKVKYGLVLRSSKPVDKAKIEELVTQGGDKPDFNPAGMEKKTHSKTKYYLFKNDNPPEPDFAAYLADDKTLVFGLESVVQSHIDLAGKISARSGLEFLDTKQQITIAYLPPNNKAIEIGVTKILAEMKVPPNAPPLQKDITQTAKTTLESLKKVEAAALSGGVTQTGLQLVASANFSDANASKTFVDSYNKLQKDSRQISEVAQTLLAMQGMGLMFPDAESKGKQASLTLAIPMNAMESLGGMIGGLAGGGETEVHYSRATVQRWTMLSQTVGKNQWPHATIIQKNLGKANEEKENAIMNPRSVLSSGAVIQTFRNTPQVPGCIRWAYYDDHRGQRAIHLYFNPNTGQMIGVHWFESGSHKTGPPHVGGGTGEHRGGDDRPGGGGVRPGGASRSIQLQTAAQAHQLLKGTWVNTSGAKVTLTFDGNGMFGTDAGSSPKTGKYGFLGVSGISVQFWGLSRTNIANIIFKSPNEFTVNQTSMVGVIPKGTFRRK